MNDDDPLPANVVVADDQTLEVDTERIAKVAGDAAKAEGASGEISVVLVDAARMSELNAKFLGEEGPTDVLAFPIDSPGGESPDASPLLLGEVVVCPEVAAAQSPGALDEELDLLVAHGVLHLLGHDHDTEENAMRMRKRERAITGREGARAS